MTRLYIKNNYKNDVLKTVRDDRGQILFLIEGQWGRKDDLIALSTIEGTQVLSAKQNTLSPFPTFYFYTPEEKIGTLRKHPGLFGIRDAYFTLQPQSWLITGDFEELYFVIHQNNKLILECEKTITNDESLFTMDIEDEADIPMGAIVTVLLDHYTRSQNHEYIEGEELDSDFNWGFLNSIDLSKRTIKKRHPLPYKSKTS